jgi:hypothetical protein
LLGFSILSLLLLLLLLLVRSIQTLIGIRAVTWHNY